MGRKLNTPAIKSEFDSIVVEEYELSFLSEWLGKGNRIFAFLDACDEPLIPPKVFELGTKAVSLYSGSAEQEHAFVAPYAVEVDEDLLAWIEQALAATPWGYFLLTGQDCSLMELRKHFRRFLKAKLPNKKRVMFRFYDPRVISTFLKSAEKQDVITIFGPVNAFGLIIPESGKINVIHRV